MSRKWRVTTWSLFGHSGLDHLLTDEANQPYLANSGDDILTVCSPEDAKDALLLRLVLVRDSARQREPQRILLCPHVATVCIIGALSSFCNSSLHGITMYRYTPGPCRVVVVARLMHVWVPHGTQWQRRSSPKGLTL